MPSQLPPELIYRILSYCTVSDKVFTDSIPPWGEETEDRSLNASSLLVSKTWLQLGRPLVYETVILNSPKHAEAFLATLQHNPSLELLVRKLRLHRCTASQIGSILKACPRITDLYLSLRFVPEDRIGILGVDLFLARARPKRVILDDPFNRKWVNASLRSAYQRIGYCISTIWLTLVSTLLLFILPKV
jgi:hypothetical protein